jgi:hypothetical protein
LKGELSPSLVRDANVTDERSDRLRIDGTDGTIPRADFQPRTLTNGDQPQPGRLSTSKLVGVPTDKWQSGLPAWCRSPDFPGKRDISSVSPEQISY